MKAALALDGRLRRGLADVEPHEARCRRARLPPTGRDGLVLCRRIKRQLPPPAVLLHSACADASLTIPARLAGADGLIDKSAPANELYDAIRRVARGEQVLPPISRELLDAAAREATDELPILGMTLENTPVSEMAATLGVTPWM
jgi:DNA-binding NarL/FixJ family response regulator